MSAHTDRTTRCEYRTDDGAGSGVGAGPGPATGTVHTERRYDRGELLSPVATPEGFLLVQGRVARPGILVYANSDGTTRRELIPAEELHRADSLGTLGRKPVTLEHPPPGVKVDSRNVEKYGVGDADGAVEVDQQGGFVVVKMAVRRADAVSAVRDGKVELSPGYDVDIEERSGEDPVFGRYDAIQRNRRYNHIAIVDRARGGHEVRLRTDGAVMLLDGERPGTPDARRTDSTSPGAHMLTLLALLSALGMPRTDAEAAASDVSKIPADLPEKAEKLKADADELASVKAQCDELQKKVDAMMAEKAAAAAEAGPPPAVAGKTDAADKADTRTVMDLALAVAARRAPLLALAAQHKVDGVDKLDNAALRKAIVLAANPKAPQDRSDAYYEAAVDALPAPAASGSAFPTGTVVPADRKDGASGKGAQPVRYDGLDSYTRGLAKSRENPTA